MMSLYKLLRRIPVLKTIVKVVNQFVYEGAWEADERFAPLRMWFSSIALPILISAFFTFLTYLGSASLDMSEAQKLIQAIFSGNTDFYNGVCRSPLLDISNLSGLTASPGSLISSVFPNLLGFGIGVYALIFAISPQILRLMQKHFENEIKGGKKNAGSFLILNASMGYPLLIIVLSLILGTFQQIYADSLWLAIVTWLAFWYGLVALIQLIGVLFGLGEHDALEKLSEHDDIGV